MGYTLSGRTFHSSQFWLRYENLRRASVPLRPSVRPSARPSVRPSTGHGLLQYNDSQCITVARCYPAWGRCVCARRSVDVVVDVCVADACEYVWCMRVCECVCAHVCVHVCVCVCV